MLSSLLAQASRPLDLIATNLESTRKRFGQGSALLGFGL